MKFFNILATENQNQNQNQNWSFLTIVMIFLNSLFGRPFLAKMFAGEIFYNA